MFGASTISDDLCLQETRGEVSVAWKIKGFFSLPREINCRLKSPAFRLSDAKWHLVIYPNGKYGTEAFVSLFLCRECSIFPEHEVAFTIGIRKRDGSNYFSEDTEYKYQENAEHGWYNFIEISKLLNDKNIVSEEGSLRVYCSVRNTATVIARKNAVESASQTASHESIEILQKHLKDLLLNSHETDVTFKVEDQEFQAHRLILCARSPVFSAMFKHDTEEKRSGIVNVQEIHPDSFKTFLYFLYTGDLNVVSSSDVAELYKAANMYDFGDLKSECVRYMTEELTVESFCSTVRLATLHSESNLLEIALDFFTENAREIFATRDWESLLIDNPALANEFLLKMARIKL